MYIQKALCRLYVVSFFHNVGHILLEFLEVEIVIFNSNNIDVILGSI